MKRRIIASSMPTPEDMMSEVINRFWNAGYDMTVTDNWEVSLVAKEDAEHMPTIEVLVERGDDEDTINFNAHIHFPELHTEEDHYYDSTAYYLNKWAKVGDCITKLLSNSIHLSDWVE